MKEVDAQLKPEYYFGNPKYSRLFEGCEFVWEAIPKIRQFIEQQLEGLEAKVEEGAIVHPTAILEGMVVVKAGAKVGPHVHIEGPVVIGTDSKVISGVYIGPRTIVGQGCEVRPGAFIRGDAFLGDGCIVRGEIKNSVLMDKVQAPHHSYIGDSILGDGCNPGAGVVFSNVKHSRGTVVVKIGERKIDTGIQKFGAIVGDGSMFGCNGTANPGTLIGQRVMTYHHASLSGFYPSNTIVKVRQTQEVVERR